mmetsp:Transcript_5281/g.7958  ORF Transcript_5281/g.7958 Transcript_5281/m.7958 type:complete len:187 (+) Transcript_5281:3-563(+)
MQNDAASTVFLYGPKMLRSVGVHVVGVPATELPPGTKHYYMTDEEISVVFEVPAGEGRIIFVGYDFNQIEPQWADVLLLAERELQLKDEVEPPPPQEKEYPKPYGITEPSAAPEEKELELEDMMMKRLLLQVMQRTCLSTTTTPPRSPCYSPAASILPSPCASYNNRGTKSRPIISKFGWKTKWHI